MGNTVSIPEEVIEQAARAFGGIVSPSWGDAPDWEREVVIDGLRNCAAPIIAAWAREQVLDEAVAALEALVRPAVTPGRLAQNHGVWDALAAVAVLRQEGEWLLTRAHVNADRREAEARVAQLEDIIDRAKAWDRWRCDDDDPRVDMPDLEVILSEADTAPREDRALRAEPDYSYIYWHDPVEGCWVAYQRADCVGDEELPTQKLPVDGGSHE